MQRIPDNIELLLPFGEALRGFMEQPFISEADLKNILRTRGVFLNRNQKSDTIPVLVCCLLSPREFDTLRECHAIREDNPKTMTRTIAWNATRPLLEAIPEALHLSDLTGDFANYKLIGTPAFVPVGNNRNDISCQFEIEREDYSKSWATTKSNFKGEVRIETISGGKAIKFTLTHTADETKDLNRKFVQRLSEHFKDNGYVNRESEIETILFSSFDNEGRIAFFRSLTDKISSSTFRFIKITDFGLCPENTATLPKELKWMEDTVTDFTVRGEALQNTFFIRGKDYHRYFLFYSIEAKFNFESGASKGTCAIAFGFPNFASKKDTHTEFEVNISSLTLDASCSEVNKVAVKVELLRHINDYKLSQFEKQTLKPAKKRIVANKGDDASATVHPKAVQDELGIFPAP